MTIRAAAALMVGLMALIAARALGPAGTPPLYDGSCAATPYVRGGPGVSRQVLLDHGTNPVAQLTTNEGQPQAQLLVMAGTFTPSAGVESVTLSITPVSTPSTLPSDGLIDGNVYDFAVVDDRGRALQPAMGSPVTLLLRSASLSSADYAIEVFNGGAWHRLTSSLSGCSDTFTATSQVMGDFAVVQLGATTSTAPDHGNVGGFVVAIIVVFVAGVGILAVRPRGRRR